jgi:CPA2 family monovalent cation:H+ antiporter-2
MGLLLIELGAVVLGLGVLGRLAARIGMSPIPLYLLAGLAFGHGGLIPLDASDDFIEIGAEIGVILLLLLLGLEYSASELTSNLRQHAFGGVVDLVANALPGAVVGLLLGWPLPAVLAMAGVTYVTSSGITAKLLTDLGRLGNRETPVVLSILVLEDLSMALYLPVLTAMLAGVSLVAGATSVAIAFIAISVAFFIALRFGRALGRFVYSDNKEVLLLIAFGLALLVAGVAHQLQVSEAVGAFLVGIALSGRVAEGAREVLTPLRDLFAAVFFVFFGLETDPSEIPAALLPAVVLAVATAFTKVGTGVWAARRSGVAIAGQMRAGSAIVSRGEFNVVIAGLATASGIIAPGFAALATAYVLIMAVTGPLIFRLGEPLGRAVARRRAQRQRRPRVQPRRTSSGEDGAVSKRA